MNRHGGSRRSAIRPLLHSSILFRPHQQPPKPVSDWRLMVEAPGYCPPGPKCLFHLTFYRHSRLPGTDLDSETVAQSQGFPALAPAPLNAKASGKAGLTPVMACSTIKTFRGFKRMK